MSDPTTVDIVIAGAGVLGCLIAAEIAARRPELDIMMVDRGTIGGGATRHSAGLDIPRGHSARVRRMAAYGRRYYADERRVLPMTVIAPAAAESGLRTRYLDGATLRAVPAIRSDLVTCPGGYRAWHGTCAHAEVDAVARGIAREIRSRVRIHEGVRVLAVEPRPAGMLLRLGTGRDVLAGRVVLAPGPWIGAPAWQEFLAPFDIRVKRVVALHIDRVPAAEDPAVIFDAEDAFLLPLSERGHWLFSYTSDIWDVMPDDPPTGVTAADLTAGQRILAKYAPGLIPHTVSGRAFCDAYSPDREPVVRCSPRDRRVVFAGAANGSGYRLGPAIAAETADLLGLHAETADPPAEAADLPAETCNLFGLSADVAAEAADPLGLPAEPAAERECPA
ncbi:NAD(P)/FAD-dependent oxidoreductase [Nocardia inohanensis]|uniref:NAD(P)/FAD-dependent oxidoreductase n=1 Tax=Nocardia inohanensis TaxID=209246 RepID=UPI000834EFBB|nr:FAD-dependent oxidoreductase [Nocardia inohanensis]